MGAYMSLPVFIGNKNEPESSSESKIPDTFHPFYRLPKELRDQIWQETENFEQPCRIHVIATTAVTYHPLTVLSNRGNVPIASKIDFQAREEALRKYTLWNTLSFEEATPSPNKNRRTSRRKQPCKKLFVNTKADMFLIGANGGSLEDYEVANNPSLGFYKSGKKDKNLLEMYNSTFGAIRHLGICFRTLLDAPESVQQQFIDCLSHFTSLKTLTIVFNRPQDGPYDQVIRDKLVEVRRGCSCVQRASDEVVRHLEQMLDSKTKIDSTFRKPRVGALVHKFFDCLP